MQAASTVEERLERIEAAVNEIREMLKAGPREPGPNDFWRTFGMFENDPVFEEIMAEGAKIREAERREARGE